MSFLVLIVIGYLIVLPHVFFSWHDLIWPKGKKIRKERQNLQWNVWLSTLSLMLLVALTVEGFRDEFSLNWFLYLSSFIVLFLFWSLKFMPGSGRGRA